MPAAPKSLFGGLGVGAPPATGGSLFGNTAAAPGKLRWHSTAKMIDNSPTLATTSLFGAGASTAPAATTTGAPTSLFGFGAPAAAKDKDKDAKGE